METEIGKVKKLQDGKAVIQMDSGPQCQHCGAKMVCGSGNGATRELTIPNTLEAKQGDSVKITYKESSRIFSAFIIFIVPILFLIAGYIFGFSRSGSEGNGTLWALIGLVFGFLVVTLVNKLFAKKLTFKPQMKSFASQYHKV